MCIKHNKNYPLPSKYFNYNIRGRRQESIVTLYDIVSHINYIAARDSLTCRARLLFDLDFRNAEVKLEYSGEPWWHPDFATRKFKLPQGFNTQIHKGSEYALRGWALAEKFIPINQLS